MTPLNALRKQGDMDDSVTRIFRVARKLFAEKGYAAVSMRDIAEAANVSKSNVFHHYKNKAELYKSVLSTCVHEFDELLDDMEKESPDNNESFEHFIQSRLKIQLSDSETSVLFIRSLIESQGPDDFDIVEDILSERFDKFIRLLPDFYKDRDFRKDVDIRTVAILLLGSHFMYWFFHPYLKDKDQFMPGPDTYSRQAGRIFDLGILNPSSASYIKTE